MKKIAFELSLLFFTIVFSLVFYQNLYPMPIEAVSNKHEDNKKNNKKNVIYAIIGDLTPLLIIQGGAIYCSKQPNNPNRTDDIEECFFYLIPPCSVISAIGTIPSHLYANSNLRMKIAFPISKFVVGGIYTGVTFATGLNASLSEYDDDWWEEMKILFITWDIALTIIHSLEIYTHIKSINKYNSELDEKSNKAQVFLAPTVWDDRVGMAFQVNF